jgi:hypothetical protein
MKQLKDMWFPRRTFHLSSRNSRGQMKRLDMVCQGKGIFVFLSTEVTDKVIWYTVCMGID